MTRRLIPLLAAAAYLLGAPASLAQTATAAMDDAALEGHRGGLMTSTGLDIGFGASVRTFVDGKLVLQTELVWAPQGVVTTRAPNASQTDASLSLSIPVLVAPGTRVIHDLRDDRIASVVINTANDRVIRQETDIALRLPQLPEIQRQGALGRVAAGLQSSAAPFRN